MGTSLGGTSTAEQNLELVRRFRDHARDGVLTVWAPETLQGDVVGPCGYIPLVTDLPIRPGIELGSLLASSHWGHGYVTEAALASLAHELVARPA